MSALAEVRRAVQAAARAAELKEAKDRQLRAAIRAAMHAPDVTLADLMKETGLSKSRLFQIKAGVRSQSRTRPGRPTRAGER